MANNEIKLYYFNARGKGEVIRWMLKLGDIPFEDIRMTKEEWGKMKSEVPTHLVPMLQYKDKDGKTVRICESWTIIRSIGRWKGWGGDTVEEQNQVDEVCEVFRDLWDSALKCRHESDPTRKAELQKRVKEEVAPRVKGYLEAKLAANGGHHFIGKKSLANVVVACCMDNLMLGKPLGELADAEVEANKAKYPLLVALHKHITELPPIAEWRAKRPNTAM